MHGVLGERKPSVGIVRLAFALSLAALAAGCGQQPAAQPVAEQPPQPSAAKFTPEKVAAHLLPNPWQIHPKVISGGLPEGDAAFAQLAALGVKTIISVDGARPDVELARKHGLRYVHLPHGYDGVSGKRAQELAKAVRDLPGVVYIHCHHGKHRSPTAAAMACVGAGLLEASSAEAVLKAAGTSANYRGLYESARQARRFEAGLLDALAVEFPETAKLPPLAEAMVAVEHTHDHLKQMAAAGWQALAEHPDLVPAHEALLLREHFTELLRTREVQSQPAQFQDLVRDSVADAEALETALRATDTKAASQALDRVTAHCAACHKTFRDVPLSQKSQAAN
jgi:protein-tyrosine phosphatase